MSFGPTIAGSKWMIDVCNLDGSFPAGSGRVFNASSKNFTYMLGSGRQMTWTMTIDNPRLPYILSNDCLAKVYHRNNNGSTTLMMVGDVVSVEEKAQGDIGTVTCVAADPFWRLGFRYLGTGTDSNGRGIGYNLGNPNTVPITTMDTSLMIQQIVNDINAYLGNTGISIGIVQNTGQGQVLGPLYAVAASEAIQQISQTVAGPEWEIVPVEPSGDWPATIIGIMSIAPHIGTLTPSSAAVFEYGIGRHTIASYDRIITKNQMGNLVFSLPQGYPTMSASNDTTVTAQDNGSIGSRGLFEYYTNDNLVSQGLRQALVDETLSILANPRQQLSFQPTVDCPLEYSVDYNVGDVVTVRAFDKSTNSFRFNGSIRIFGVEIATDENDAETTTVTTTPDASTGTTFPNAPTSL